MYQLISTQFYFSLRIFQTLDSILVCFAHICITVFMTCLSLEPEPLSDASDGLTNKLGDLIMENKINRRLIYWHRQKICQTKRLSRCSIFLNKNYSCRYRYLIILELFSDEEFEDFKLRLRLEADGERRLELFPLSLWGRDSFWLDGEGDK